MGLVVGSELASVDAQRRTSERLQIDVTERGELTVAGCLSGHRGGSEADGLLNLSVGRAAELASQVEHGLDLRVLLNALFQFWPSLLGVGSITVLKCNLPRT